MRYKIWQFACTRSLDVLTVATGLCAHTKANTKITHQPFIGSACAKSTPASFHVDRHITGCLYNIGIYHGTFGMGQLAPPKVVLKPVVAETSDKATSCAGLNSGIKVIQINAVVAWFYNGKL